MTNEFGRMATAITGAAKLKNEALAEPTVGFKASVQSPSRDYAPGGMA